MRIPKALRSLLSAIAPTLGTALGGPLGGMAATTIAQAVLGKDKFDGEEVLQALQNPDALTKLKELEYQFKTDMQAAQIDMEQIASLDRDSARRREVDKDDWTPTVLASLLVVAFGVVLWYVLVHGTVPGGEIAYMLIGALTAEFSRIMTYYFGSSAGSKQKTEILQQRDV